MKHWIFLTMATFVLAACNAGPNRTNIEIIDNMMDQEHIKSQDWVPAEGDKVQMRQPPENTVPRGSKTYRFANDPGAGDAQKNPFSSDMSAEFLTVGRQQYDLYCALCHGIDGAGAGQIAEKMAVKPRNLLLPEAKAFSDGRLYHAIAAGRGVMGSYAMQMPDSKKRWAVVNYIRTLQKQAK